MKKLFIFVFSVLLACTKHEIELGNSYLFNDNGKLDTVIITGLVIYPNDSCFVYYSYLNDSIIHESKVYKIDSCIVEIR
jgi:hypothetical protein